MLNIYMQSKFSVQLNVFQLSVEHLLTGVDSSLNQNVGSSFRRQMSLLCTLLQLLYRNVYHNDQPINKGFCHKIHIIQQRAQQPKGLITVRSLQQYLAFGPAFVTYDFAFWRLYLELHGESLCVFSSPAGRPSQQLQGPHNKHPPVFSQLFLNLFHRFYSIFPPFTFPSSSFYHSPRFLSQFFFFIVGSTVSFAENLRNPALYYLYFTFTFTTHNFRAK